MPKDTREPQEILTHIISSRVALTSAIFGLSEEQLIAPGAAGKWSVKDLMAHIGHWEQVGLEELQIHLRGERSGKNYRDAVALNDEWEAGLQALSLQESITMFEAPHYQLFGLLAALPAERWNGYVRAWVQGATWHHFEEHAEQIRAWRQSL
ncbi:MAG TPA: DinB family protein [Ktedonobacteraceae bacterium]|nr:DinB family protein [Ktedonobacteraceae bacterium]